MGVGRKNNREKGENSGKWEFGKVKTEAFLRWL